MSKKHKIILIAAVVVLVLGSAGGLLAKYRSEQLRQAEMIAADFHFSSDYLLETAPTYSVSGWTEGIEIKLYNYEKENPALISALDVGYTVTVSSDQFQVLNGTGTFTGKSGDTATVTIMPKANVTVDKLTVTVNTTPYNEGLSATFTLVGQQAPTLEVIGNSTDTHYIVKIRSNSHSGTVSLTWPDGLIPDATNDHVDSTWVDGTGSFEVVPFHTYEIIFFNPAGLSSDGIGFAE